MKNVFITGISSFFPNSPVSNDEMEEYLGLISGKHSRVQRIVLKQNGIKQRYYALNKKQEITHTNAEMAMGAINKLLHQKGLHQTDIELLACATATPDQLLPSHASMVHGLWEEPVEIFSSAGVCLSCLQALKIAYWAVASSEKRNAICSTSELVSAMLLSKNFDIEYEKCCDLGVNPYMALEKDFLRFMLSDGASCALLENKPGTGKSLKIEWIEMDSYACETATCMFAGAVRTEDGELKSWKAFKSQDLVDKSLMVIKQDIKLLGEKLIPLWIRHIDSSLTKHDITPDSIDYVIPHSSSMVIYNNLIDAMKERNFNLHQKKWFTNLTRVGNIGSSAILAALDEFWRTHELKSGEKILLLVPESGRFSYGTVLLSVV
jgi:3-oxoacyl-[acyl-carrier-protein] synthase-3